MTIIDSIRQFISTCPYLDELTNGIKTDWINQTDSTDYGIYHGGEIILEEYMSGTYRKQCTFFVQSSRMGMEDILRLNNSDFLEKFETWVNSRRRIGFELPETCDYEAMTVENGTAVDVSDDGQTFLYRVTGNLIYERNI